MTQDKSFDRRYELVRLKAQVDYCNTLIAFLEQEENGQQAKETDNLEELPLNEVQRREQIAKSVGETIQHSIPDHQPAKVSKMQPSCEVPSVAQQAMGSIESKLRHVLSSEGSLYGPLSQTDASIGLDDLQLGFDQTDFDPLGERQSCAAKPDGNFGQSVQGDSESLQEDLHQSTEEYPNGEVSYERKAGGESERMTRSVGWALTILRHKKYEETGRKWYKKGCLGVYQCPKCPFVERPRQPDGEKAMLPPKGNCKIDGSSLVHVSCHAILEVDHLKDTVHFTHTGIHNHARPPPIRADPASHRRFKEMVEAAPEARPKMILLGGRSRIPAHEIHLAYANLSRSAYHIRKIRKDRSPSSMLAALTSFERAAGCDFIRSSSIAQGDGHVSMQTDFCRKQTALVSTGMQSDSVHGFVLSDQHSDINVTFTSVYNEVIQRTMPLLISMMFGKSKDHYKKHFLVLLQSLEYDTWQDFQDQFPGMTCDFSEAERVGFEMALRSHYRIPSDEVIVLERYFRCCEVHFRRSLNRVERNSGAVPHDKKEEYRRLALGMLHADKATFADIVDQLRKEFPDTKYWLDWYLHPLRGKHIFDSMATSDLSKLPKDTNAQESLGADFQLTMGTKVPDLCDLMDHTLRYMTGIELDHKLASKGASLRYSRTVKPRRKAPPYSNDGRAPDTTATLLRRPATGGRPKGSLNKIPKLGSEVDWKSFGIPWGVSHHGFTATNTCPLDTALMTWYLLSRYAGATLPGQIQQTSTGMTLQSVLEDISSSEYNRARWRWCTKVLGLSDNASHDLFGTMNSVFLDHFKSLHTFRATTTSLCDFHLCPKLLQVSELSLDSLSMLEPRQIKQDNFNKSLTLPRTLCSTMVPPDSHADPGAKAGVYRCQTVHDTESGETTRIYTCPGWRTSEPMVFSSLPYLLVLDCLENWHSSQATIRHPSSILKLEDKEYTLAAIIYGNGSHFCSTTIIQGRAVFYDGMRQRKLEWKEISKAQVPEGYQMNQVWYLTRTQAKPHSSPDLSLPPDSPSPQPESDVVSNMTNGPASPSPSLPDLFPSSAPSSPNPPSQRPLSQPTAPKPIFPETEYSSSFATDNPVSLSQPPVKKRRPFYPFGLSKHTVSNHGRPPTCGGCGETLEKGGWRFVHRVVTDAARSFSATTSYHFREACIQSFDTEVMASAQLLLDDHDV